MPRLDLDVDPDALDRDLPDDVDRAFRAIAEPDDDDVDRLVRDLDRRGLLSVRMRGR